MMFDNFHSLGSLPTDTFVEEQRQRQTARELLCGLAGTPSGPVAWLTSRIDGIS